jgi:hypothetical protein
VQLGQVYQNERCGFAVRVVPNPYYFEQSRRHRFHVEHSAAGHDPWRVIGRTAELVGAAGQVAQYLGPRIPDAPVAGA